MPANAEYPEMIKLIMDDREPIETMLPAFERCGCFRIAISRLPVGDYLLDGSLLIERKTLPDLVESIIEGRLFSQALRLLEAKHPAALLLEGAASDLKASRMRWEAIQGALVTVSLFMGLPVLRSHNPEETVHTILYAARQRRSSETRTLTRRTRRPKGRAALQSYILQGLPGVGPERAKRLLSRFGSVQGVINASAAVLNEIEGLGADTVRRIRAAVE